MKKTIPAVLAVGALALGGCGSGIGTQDSGAQDSGRLAGSETAAGDTPTTIEQQNAINSVQAYLGTGTGYSRSALIRLLQTPAGGGYAYADIVFALTQVAVSWNAEAVLAAKAYLAAGGSTRAGLIRRLSAKGGEGFTEEEAAYAADQLGL